MRTTLAIGSSLLQLMCMCLPVYAQHAPAAASVTHAPYGKLRDGTTVDSGLIPTGEIAQVARTPFDFRKRTRVGARIDADDAQLNYGKGYDHNYVIEHDHRDLVMAAKVVEPTSGRVLGVVARPAISVDHDLSIQN